MSPEQEQQVIERLAASRRELSESSKDLRQAFDLGRWGRSLAKSLRDHLYAWMSLAAMVGRVLSGIPKKKQKVYMAVSDHGKGGQKLLPLARELLTAVGLTLLKGKVKAWGFALFAKRKRSAPEGASSRRVSSQSAPQARGDSPAKKSKSKAKAGKPLAGKSYPAQALGLLKNTASEWVQDKCPQLGAALAYYTVFSLAPLVLVLLAVFGLIFGGSEHAREKIAEQLRYFIDPSGVKVIQDIAANASKPKSGILATTLGVLIALFGASGVFGQLQDALNTIWGDQKKPRAADQGADQLFGQRPPLRPYRPQFLHLTAAPTPATGGKANAGSHPSRGKRTTASLGRR